MSKQGTFPWEIGDTPVFPIDYSIRSYLKRKNKTKVTEDQVNQYIISQPWFERITDLLYSGESREDKEDRNTLNYSKTIPLELTPLIDAYMEIVCNAEKKKFGLIFPRKTASSRRDANEGILSDDKIEKVDKLAKEFLSELAKKIHVSILFDENVPFDSFFSKQFYQNHFLNEQVVRYMWERNISPRYETILKLLPNVEVITQADVLSELLFSMDRAIYSLKKCNQNNNSSNISAQIIDHKELNNILFNISSQFLKNRLNTIKSNSYHVPNVDFIDEGNNTNMESAFNSLKPQPNQKANVRKGTLIENARNAYLDYLNEQHKYPPFQQRILGIENYLTSVLQKKEDSQLQSKIKRLFYLEVSYNFDIAYTDVHEELLTCRNQLLETGYLGNLVYYRIQLEAHKIFMKNFETFMYIINTEYTSEIHALYGNDKSVIDALHSLAYQMEDDAGDLFGLLKLKYHINEKKIVNNMSAHDFAILFFRQLCSLWHDIYADNQEVANCLPEEKSLMCNADSFLLSKEQIDSLIYVQIHSWPSTKKILHLPFQDDITAEDLYLCYQFYNTIISDPDLPYNLRIVEYFVINILKPFYFYSVASDAIKACPKLIDFTIFEADMYSPED